MSPTAAMAECCRSGHAQHAHDAIIAGGASNLDAIATLIFSSALTPGVVLDSGKRSKSESCVQSVARCRCAVASITLSAIAIPCRIESRAASMAVARSRSTTLPCSITATARNASSSLRCWLTRLNTSNNDKEGTRSDRVDSIGFANTEALGPSEKYSSQA